MEHGQSWMKRLAQSIVDPGIKYRRIEESIDDLFCKGGLSTDQIYYLTFKDPYYFTSIPSVYHNFPGIKELDIVLPSNIPNLDIVGHSQFQEAELEIQYYRPSCRGLVDTRRGIDMRNELLRLSIIEEGLRIFRDRKEWIYWKEDSGELRYPYTE